eukprot:2859084-Prymnesium_polylepis.1
MCTARPEAMVAIEQAVVYESPSHASPRVHGRRTGATAKTASRGARLLQAIRSHEGFEQKRPL